MLCCVFVSVFWGALCALLHLTDRRLAGPNGEVQDR